MRVVETTPRTRARRPARWRDRRLLKRVSVVEDMAMVVAGLATNSDLIRWRFPRHKLKNVTNWWIWEGKTDGPRGAQKFAPRQVRTKCKFGGEVRGEQLRHVPVPSWKCTAKIFGIPT